MKEKEIRALLEGAYAQTPTFPGYWLKFDDLQERFKELVANHCDEIVGIEKVISEYYPEAKYQENYQLTGSPEVFRAIRIAPNKLTLLRDIKKKLENAIKNSRPIDGDGWKDFALIGTIINKDEVIAMGFWGFRHAVESIFHKRYEFKKGDVTKREAPLQIRDLKTQAEVDSDEKEYTRQANSDRVPKGVMANPKQGSYIGDAIDKYAFFPRKGGTGRGWDLAINDLADSKALEEAWWYNDTDADKITKPILKNYISYTFERLKFEDEQEKIRAKAESRKPVLKILENNNFAIWNTGLVDNIYDPIYAFFGRNDGRDPKVKQPWIFIDFNTANSYCQRYINEFPYKPARASYFDDPRELFYDTTAQAPTLDFDHFLKDNIERIPQGFLKRGFDDRFSFKEHPEELPKSQRQYFKDLADAIYADEEWKQFVTTRFKNAVIVALSRVAWNYKTAIPVYYITDKKMQLLLPLALENKTRIDVALVCEHVYRPEDGVNNYLGKTILTLEMAYNNARLITRPDSDWLMADRHVAK